MARRASSTKPQAKDTVALGDFALRLKQAMAERAQVARNSLNQEQPNPASSPPGGSPGSLGWGLMSSSATSRSRRSVRGLRRC